MKKIYVLVPLLAAQLLLSQTTPEPTSVSNPMDNIKQLYPAAPTANNLMKFEEVPVSNYTGIPDINIPIINIPIPSLFTDINISINYHPNNAKPDDKSSEVGLGWSVLAGGSITRTVRGTPDDQNVVLSTGSQPSIGIYFDEYTSNFIDKNYARKYLDEVATGAGTPPNNDVYKKLFYEAQYFNRYDTEYDLYQYNFLGYTGRFLIKKDSNNQLYVDKLDKNNLKISINSVSNDNSFEANSFMIVDEQGNKYIFDINEKSQRSLLTDRVGFKGHISTNAANLGNVISAFHLSKIKDESNTDFVNFNYYPAQSTIYTDYSQIFRSTNVSIQPDEVTFDKEIPAIQETTTMTTTSMVRSLKDIEIVGKGKITFSYVQGREDSNFTNPQQLSKLDKISMIDNSGKELESYRFNYEYFTYRLLGRDTDEKRLSLKKVTKYNSSGIKEFDYVLDYNQNTSGFSLGKDHWDWFNCVKPTDNYLTAKEPSNSCITTNLLKSIKLPTGGSRSFDFGNNTYSFMGDQPVDIYQNMDNWDHLNAEATYLKTENHVRKYLLSISSPQTVEFECLANQIANDIWDISIYKKVGNNYSFVTSIGTSVDADYIPYQTRNLDAGEYYVVFNADFTTNYSGTINLIASYKNKKTTNLTNYLWGGGARINSISYLDQQGDTTPAKKINFNYEDISVSSKSSGALVFPKPVHSYDYDYNNVFVYVCNGGQLCEFNFGRLFTIFSTNNFLPVQKTQGADVGYQYVSVSETGKGKSIFTYTSPIDIPNPDQISPTMPPFVPIANYDYKRGLLLVEQKKDNNSTLIYKKNSQYDQYDSEKLSGITLRYGDAPYSEYLYAGNFKTYEAYLSGCVSATSAYCNNYSSGMIAVTNNREIIGKANLNQSETTEFFNGRMIKNNTITIFNANDLPISTTSVLSDGESNITNYKYSNEKGNQRLLDANIISIPLEVETKKNNDVISKTETKYDNPLNLFPSSIQLFNIENQSFEPQLIYDQYDSKGNLQQYTTKDGISTTIIWGYNQTQPIAKIEGAKLSDIGQSLIDAIVSASNTDAGAASGNDETALLSALNTFRTYASVSGYQITTYTYDPFVGVRSITQPSGLREVYFYDAANRLKEIRKQNQAGKLLNEYQYNYKN